jgi:hypothetical protein
LEFPDFSLELSLSAERSLRAGFDDAARFAACKSLIAVTNAALGIFIAPSIPSWTPTLRSSGRSIALRSLAGLRARVEVSVTFPHSGYLAYEISSIGFLIALVILKRSFKLFRF